MFSIPPVPDKRAVDAYLEGRLNAARRPHFPHRAAGGQKSEGGAIVFALIFAVGNKGTLNVTHPLERKSAGAALAWKREAP